MSEKKACPFCRIDTMKNRVLENWGSFFVTLSNPRLMEGHLLVIPHRHVGGLYDLRWDEQAEIFGAVLRLQKKLIAAFSEVWQKPAGCDVSWHTRPFMSQTEISIPEHAHIHLRPRFWQDPYYENVLRYETPVFQPLSSEELTRVSKLLAK